MTNLAAFGRHVATAACTIVLSGLLLLGALGPAAVPAGQVDAPASRVA